MLAEKELVLEKFRKFLEKRTELNEASVRVYLGCVKRFINFCGDWRSPVSYERFLEEYMFRKRVYNYRFALKYFVRFYVRSSRVREKIYVLLKRVKVKEPKVKRVYLSLRDRLRLIYCLRGEKHKVIAYIMCMGGLRFSDVCRLRRGDVSFGEDKGRSITRLNVSGKGGKVFVVVLYELGVQDALFEHMKVFEGFEDFLFLDTVLDEVSLDRLLVSNYKRFIKDFDRAVRLFGLSPKDFSSHDFRRCFAVDNYDRDKDLYRLQRLMNHMSIKTTARYLRFSGVDVKDDMFKFQVRDEDADL